jgi:ABC-type Zn uptake system ZnuABC Zn-binding protein ZnuA
MTEKKFNKTELESLVLQEIMSRPYMDFGGNKVHYIATEYEALFIKNMEGNFEVTNLMELEDAVNSPDVKTVFIGRDASITSKLLGKVLERTNLQKQIFCAFKVK